MGPSTRFWHRSGPISYCLRAHLNASSGPQRSDERRKYRVTARTFNGCPRASCCWKRQRNRYSKGATRRLDFNRQRPQCSTSLDETNLTVLANTLRIQNSSRPTSLFHRLQREDFPSENARFARFLNVHVDHTVLTANAGCCSCLKSTSLSQHIFYDCLLGDL